MQRRQTIFVNLSHPAHFHFFRRAIVRLKERGHRVIVGARDKDCTLELLESSRLDFVLLTRKSRHRLGLAAELVEQQWKIAKLLLRNRVDLMLQCSGIFNAPVGRLFGVPTLAFSDTEIDVWSNRVSFPLSRHVFSPDCFDHSIGGRWKNQILYPGYHELAYLAPPELDEKGDREACSLVRFVGWTAAHDAGVRGLSRPQKIDIVRALAAHTEVHISSEGPIPAEIAQHAVRAHPAQMLDLLRRCKIVVGESATMCSEAACLGIPSVFISRTPRGYTSEQEKRYELVRCLKPSQHDEVLQVVEDLVTDDDEARWQRRRWTMLRDKIDVTAWLVDLVEGYPLSVADAAQGRFENYRFQRDRPQARPKGRAT